jgi:hypothetical protein
VRAGCEVIAEISAHNLTLGQDVAGIKVTFDGDAVFPLDEWLPPGSRRCAIQTYPGLRRNAHALREQSRDFYAAAAEASLPAPRSLKPQELLRPAGVSSVPRVRPASCHRCAKGSANGRIRSLAYSNSQLFLRNCGSGHTVPACRINIHASPAQRRSARICRAGGSAVTNSR